MYYYIVSNKNGEMYQRSYSVINRKRSLVDDQQYESSKLESLLWRR
jgi:hypothetical protein